MTGGGCGFGRMSEHYMSRGRSVTSVGGYGDLDQMEASFQLPSQLLHQTYRLHELGCMCDAQAELSGQSGHAMGTWSWAPDRD